MQALQCPSFFMTGPGVANLSMTTAGFWGWGSYSLEIYLQVYFYIKSQWSNLNRSQKEMLHPSIFISSFDGNRLGRGSQFLWLWSLLRDIKEKKIQGLQKRTIVILAFTDGRKIGVKTEVDRKGENCLLNMKVLSINHNNISWIQRILGGIFICMFAHVWCSLYLYMTLL